MGRVGMAVGPAAGALISGNRTAGVILAATAAAVLLLTSIGTAINALPEWFERWERSRDRISRGRHLRKTRTLRGKG
ncbi:MAG TPA: hypothetical protein VF927_10175 [Solirubrobacteraceae bacterium]